MMQRKESAMIELTEQQWQALAGEDPPRVVAPNSKEMYVLIRQDTYLHWSGRRRHAVLE
jgi:hypothetical protein